MWSPEHTKAITLVLFQKAAGFSDSASVSAFFDIHSPSPKNQNMERNSLIPLA